MTVEDAIKLLNQVCGSVQATLDVHQKIQEALRVLSESALQPKV